MNGDKKVLFSESIQLTMNQMMTLLDGRRLDDVSLVSIALPIVMAGFIGWDCDQLCRMIRLNWSTVRREFVAIDIDPPK